MILFLLTGELILYWTAPFSADNGSNGFRLTPWLSNGLRYGYLVAALLSGLAARAVQGTGLPGQRLGLALVVGCGLWAVRGLDGLGQIAMWSSTGLALGLSAAVIKNGWPSARQTVSGFGIGVLLVGLLAIVMFPSHMGKRAKLYGPVCQALDEQADNDGVVVVNSLELIRYAGRDWTRPITMSRPGDKQTTGEWLSGLRARGYRWLVFGTAGLDGQAGAVQRLGRDLESPNPDLKLRVTEEGLRFDERLYEISSPSAP